MSKVLYKRPPKLTAKIQLQQRLRRQTLRDCDIWHIGSNIRVQKAFQAPEVSHSGAREEKGLENIRRWRMVGAGEEKGQEKERLLILAPVQT